MYAGALADRSLSLDAFTGSRYGFGGGKPLSWIELDGHIDRGFVGHTVFDVAGMVPVIGEAADIANGIWYAAEGDYTNAGLSFAGAIPIIVDERALASVREELGRGRRRWRDAGGQIETATAAAWSSSTRP